MKRACAGKPSHSSLITGTSDVTLDTSHVERIHANVVCSALENMKEITMERNLMNIIYVVKPSVPGIFK